MRVFVIFFAIIFSAATAYPQQQHQVVQPVTFGVRAGLDLQNLNGTNAAGNDLDLSLATRFNVGAIVEVAMAPDFSFQSGLLFPTKGASRDDESYNLRYLELPLHLLYRPILGNGYLLLGFGPYLGYAISGSYSYPFEGFTQEGDIEFTSDYDGEWQPGYFRPFDFGGNLFFGYEFFGGFSVQLNTQLGLMNIKAENTTLSDDQSSYMNTGFGLSFGFKF